MELNDRTFRTNHRRGLARSPFADTPSRQTALHHTKRIPHHPSINNPTPNFSAQLKAGEDPLEFAEHISVVDEDGGTGIHELTGANGTIVRVQSREMKSTLFTDGQGALIGEAERGDETTVCDAQGATVFRVVAHPDDAKSTDAFRALLVDAAGTEFCSLDIIRRAAGWSIGRDLVPSRGSLRKLNDRLPKLEVWPSMPNAHRLNFESNSTPNA